MLASLRKENYAAFGFDTEVQPTDEEKFAVIASLTDEQKHIIQRDFIIKQLSDTSGIRRQSHLLIEFATLYFPEKVKKIKEAHNASYMKKNFRIEERIREIQPLTGTKAIEAATAQANEAVVVSETEDCMGTFPQVIDTEYEEVTETETFDESNVDDVPLYPRLPERVSIGEIPEEDEHLGTVDEMKPASEIAA
jgi:hypothetical protein